MSAARATILIVDDDADVIHTFSRMLRLEGYKVVTAHDAEAGLREMTTIWPDVVLLDLRMPLMDGLTFLRRLRARERGRCTPVAVITGDYFVEEGLLCELRALHAVVCFKPMWLDDVLKIIEDLLRRPTTDRSPRAPER